MSSRTPLNSDVIGHEDVRSHRLPAGGHHPVLTTVLVLVLVLAFVATGLLLLGLFVATAVPAFIVATLSVIYAILLFALLSCTRTRRVVLMVLAGLLLLSMAAVVASRAFDATDGEPVAIGDGVPDYAQAS